jgi:hypothetical protein
MAQDVGKKLDKAAIFLYNHFKYHNVVLCLILKIDSMRWYCRTVMWKAGGNIPMAQAIVAREQGDEYQARWFWMNVCRMFDNRSKVIRVIYEQENVKSFDDLGVFYKEGMQDENGNPLTADYTQVKFHVTAAGAITWQGMTDPAFINASSISLLQRLKNAQQQYAPQGVGSRFSLYTPWSVHPDDLLASI